MRKYISQISPFSTILFSLGCVEEGPVIAEVNETNDGPRENTWKVTEIHVEVANPTIPPLVLSGATTGILPPGKYSLEELNSLNYSSQK